MQKNFNRQTSCLPFSFAYQLKFNNFSQNGLNLLIGEFVNRTLGMTLKIATLSKVEFFQHKVHGILDWKTEGR